MSVIVGPVLGTSADKATDKAADKATDKAAAERNLQCQSIFNGNLQKLAKQKLKVKIIKE